MAVTITVENGSIVENANSYVDLAAVRAYADARTASLPADDEAVKAAMVRATDYLETYGPRYQGRKVEPGLQALQWPRQCVVIEGYSLPDDVIPVQLKNAQCQLTIEAAAGLDLMPTGDGREVIREKVDVLETEYAAGAGGAPQPSFKKAMAILGPLLKSNGSSIITSRA